MSDQAPEAERVRGHELMCDWCGCTRWACLTQFVVACCGRCEHPSICDHELGGPGGLPCDNHDEHPGNGRGCTYTGTWATDRHDLTEARDE